MERNIKCKPTNLCMIIFMLCLPVRFVEYFLIETDKTAIGENVLHKVFGIIFLALALKKINLTWHDIGFQRNGFVSDILKGLLLGSVCFAVSFEKISGRLCMMKMTGKAFAKKLFGAKYERPPRTLFYVTPF